MVGSRYPSDEPGPAMVEIEDEHVDPIMKRIWTIRAAVPATIMLVIFTISSIFVSPLLFALVCVLPITVTLVIIRIVVGVAYRNYKYSIREDHILIKRGIITRSRVMITFDRVQNVNTVAKILDRHYGVGSVLIETAGGAGLRTGGAEGYIHGLRHPKAMATFILERARSVAGGELADDGLYSSARRRTPIPETTVDHAPTIGTESRSQLAPTRTQLAILDQLEIISHQLDTIKRRL